MVKIRDSRIELLRIVLMWTVVAHHFVVHNADSVSVFPGSFTRFFYNIFFYPIGRTAVRPFCIPMLSSFFLKLCELFSPVRF